MYPTIHPKFHQTLLVKPIIFVRLRSDIFKVIKNTCKASKTICIADLESKLLNWIENGTLMTRY